MRLSRINTIELVRWLGVALIMAVGIAHMNELLDRNATHWAQGVVFFANFIGCMLAALAIGCDSRNFGWRGGFLITAASLCMYTLSQFITFPGLRVRLWSEPTVLYALAVEVLFITLFFIVSLYPAWNHQLFPEQAHRDAVYD